MAKRSKKKEKERKKGEEKGGEEKGDRHLFGLKTSMICHPKTCLSPFS
jgi:hypothetical protein